MYEMLRDHHTSGMYCKQVAIHKNAGKQTLMRNDIIMLMNIVRLCVVHSIYLFLFYFLRK